jgi:hypothetical protein
MADSLTLLRQDIVALAGAHRQVTRILERRSGRGGAVCDRNTLRCERVARMLDARIRLKAEQLAAWREAAPRAARSDS